ALKIYRSRVDGQAKKLFDEGMANHDVAALKRLIKEAFCSKYGDEALDLLGDLAFERGRFEEARRWWSMIILPASEPLTELPKQEQPKSILLLFPNPQKNLAHIRAKQLLSLVFMGDKAQFHKEMLSFKEIHGKAEGSFAGKKGNLAEILEATSKSISPCNDGPALSSWCTFAGAADRQRGQGTLPDHPNWLAHLCAEPPCRIDLTTRQIVSEKENGQPDKQRTGLSFPYYPAIIDRFVLVADGSGVVLYDPAKGKSAEWHGKVQMRNVRVPPANEPDHTVTIYQGKTYASLGQGEESKLVCLDMELGADPSLHERWLIPASTAAEKEPWAFEGSPAVENGRAYVSMSQKTASQTKYAVACFNADTGTAFWRREVCQAARLDATQASATSNLLTLAEGRVYFCSHSGVIVCLDDFSGQMIWAVRYPVKTSGRTTSESAPRTSCPCVVVDGRIFAAPMDSDRLLCLDAFSGQMLWSREGQEAVHLLGAGQKRLVFTTKRGIRWLEASTGLDVQSHPDGGTGALASQGRGLLAGDLVFWPTRQGLFVLTQREGDLPNELNVYNLLKGQPLGNLALTSKLLAIAGPHELTVYVSPALKRDELRKSLEKNPNSIKALTRLAWGDLDSLEFKNAADRFDLAVGLVRTALDAKERRMLPTVLSEQHFALCRLAESVGGGPSLNEAVSYLNKAASASFSPHQQVVARFKKAKILENAGGHDQAIETYQSILSDSTLRFERTQDDKGLSQPAALLAAQKIDAILGESGPVNYKAIAARAQERLAAIDGDNRKNKLLCLKREFPNADFLDGPLLDLADQAAAVGDKAKAARIYRALEQYRVNNLPGMIGLEDKLANLFSKVESNDSAGNWQRGFDVALDPDETLLHESSGSSSDYFFTANRRCLVCRDGSSGAVRWQQTFPDDPGWINKGRGLVAVGAASYLAVLSLDEGEILWQYRPTAIDDRPSSLSCFQVPGNQFFCKEGQRQILAFDLIKGTCLWRHGLLSAGLPLFQAATPYLAQFLVQGPFVLAVSQSSKAQILDARTGDLIQAIDIGSNISLQPWTSPKDQMKCLVTGASQIIMLDLGTGKRDWTHVIEGSSSLRHELPTILRHGDDLAVLFRRNYGDTLLRLDPVTGQKLWSEEQWLGVSPCGSASIKMGPTGVVFVLDNCLTTRSLADGRVLWERSLPESGNGWSLGLINEDIICWPSREISETKQGYRPFKWSFAHPWGTIECCLSFGQDGSDWLTTSVMIVDAKTGEPSQRLNLDSSRGRLTIANRPGISQERDTKIYSDVCILNGQILLASNGNLWSLNTKPLPKQSTSGSDRN
ncbi:MAG TPA: PQQ-binding-like beta-propeller repeat protein, partial [Gemmataceae bacterium]|nr:PQQ-binding-like beta-propeller repeat protein [Gemmataceae bacterium]